LLGDIQTKEAVMKTKFRVLMIVLLAMTLLPAACGPAPTVAPSPTANPSLPPGDATITFENDECTYDGLQPIPAGHSFKVNWVIKDPDHKKSKFGLYVFTLDEGKTGEDLMAAQNEPTPPLWAHAAGGWDSSFSIQVPVNAEKAPLYFTCWSSPPDAMFQVIGPVEVASTNP
jgi:hypothetical protein